MTETAKPVVVLLVEDNRTNLMLMELLVRQVPDCLPLAFADPQQLVAELPSISYDIAVVDYQMPGLNGIDLIKLMRAAPGGADRPIVMVTADNHSDIKLGAINAGAIEFLTKPLEPIEFKARLANLARLSLAQRALADRAEWLRQEVEKATAGLRRREEEVIDRLATAAGYKDRETAQHTMRMARYCRLLARALGLDEQHCRDIQLAAPMHDIGKVGIRDNVLLKQGPLTPEERAHINEHTRIGAAILANPESTLLKIAAEIAATHHEKWDGSGYPMGLAGTAIPLAGRIAAVADVFDALTSARSYKPAWPVQRAYEQLRAEAGTHFDPVCVAAFETCRADVERIMREWPDAETAAA